MGAPLPILHPLVRPGSGCCGAVSWSARPLVAATSGPSAGWALCLVSPRLCAGAGGRGAAPPKGGRWSVSSTRCPHRGHCGCVSPVSGGDGGAPRLALAQHPISPGPAPGQLAPWPPRLQALEAPLAREGDLCGHFQTGLSPPPPTHRFLKGPPRGCSQPALGRPCPAGGCGLSGPRVGGGEPGPAAWPGAQGAGG